MFIFAPRRIPGAPPSNRMGWPPSPMARPMSSWEPGLLGRRCPWRPSYSGLRERRTTTIALYCGVGAPYLGGGPVWASGDLGTHGNGLVCAHGGACPSARATGRWVGSEGSMGLTWRWTPLGWHKASIGGGMVVSLSWIWVRAPSTTLLPMSGVRASRSRQIKIWIYGLRHA